MQSVTLSCGEVVVVQRLAPMLQSLIIDQSRQMHPPPDPKQYQRPLANAAIEGALEPAEMNPEYNAAVAKATLQQSTHLINKFLQCGVVNQVEDEENEVTVARYADQLAMIRAAVGQLDAPNDFQAVVLYILIQSPEDRTNILKAAQGRLTQEDVERASALFRRKLQRNARDDAPEGTASPGLSA